MKKIFEITGLAYAVMVFVSAGIMAYAEWNTVKGFFAHWDLIITCMWRAGLWPIYLPLYFS
jgi:hypothetical protein